MIEPVVDVVIETATGIGDMVVGVVVDFAHSGIDAAAQAAKDAVSEAAR